MKLREAMSGDIAISTKNVCVGGYPSQGLHYYLPAPVFAYFIVIQRWRLQTRNDWYKGNLRGGVGMEGTGGVVRGSPKNSS